MGKRGPPARGEFTNKAAVLSTRIKADTREALEGAAAASRRSLSQEIEYRLRRSFLEDERIADVFGSRRNYATMRLIASAIEAIGLASGARDDWINQPFAFDQALKAVVAVMEALRPPGDASTATSGFSGKPMNELARMLGPDLHKTAAGVVLGGVRDADPTSASVGDFFSNVRTDLSSIAERLMQPDSEPPPAKRGPNK